MPSEDIDKGRWPHFCPTFARRHRGWLVSVHERDTAALPADATDEPMPAEGLVAQDMALHGIDCQTPEAEGASLTLALAGPNGPLTYAIADPVRLSLERTATGADQGLRIDSDTGRTVFLRFRAAAQPEALDGLADLERSTQETGC